MNRVNPYKDRHVFVYEGGESVRQVQVWTVQANIATSLGREGFRVEVSKLLPCPNAWLVWVDNGMLCVRPAPRAAVDADCSVKIILPKGFQEGRVSDKLPNIPLPR